MSTWASHWAIKPVCNWLLEERAACAGKSICWEDAGIAFHRLWNTSTPWGACAANFSYSNQSREGRGRSHSQKTYVWNHFHVAGPSFEYLNCLQLRPTPTGYSQWMWQSPIHVFPAPTEIKATRSDKRTCLGWSRWESHCWRHNQDFWAGDHCWSMATPSKKHCAHHQGQGEKPPISLGLILGLYFYFYLRLLLPWVEEPVLSLLLHSQGGKILPVMLRNPTPVWESGSVLVMGELHFKRKRLRSFMWWVLNYTQK